MHTYNVFSTQKEMWKTNIMTVPVFTLYRLVQLFLVAWSINTSHCTTWLDPYYCKVSTGDVKNTHYTIYYILWRLIIINAEKVLMGSIYLLMIMTWHDKLNITKKWRLKMPEKVFYIFVLSLKKIKSWNWRFWERKNALYTQIHTYNFLDS